MYDAAVKIECWDSITNFDADPSDVVDLVYTISQQDNHADDDADEKEDA